MRRALLELDDRRLSADDLRAISKQLPTPEEVSHTTTILTQTNRLQIARIKDFGDVSKLAKADQFFSEIMTVPRLAGRLESMMYRGKLDLEMAEIRPDLNMLRNASRELRQSTKFKKVLQVVLAVGNALNASTFRGGAKGFRLESLLKVSFARQLV